MIKIDSLIWKVQEYMDAENDYRHSSAVYYRKNGHGVNLGHVRNAEEQHIAYAYHYSEKESETVWTLCDVLNFDQEKTDRLFSAARALRKWEMLTGYQKLPSEDLLIKLYSFIVGRSRR